MASGCCIVASDVAAVKEWAHKDATIFVNHTNHEELSQCLQKAVDMGREHRIERGVEQRQLIKAKASRDTTMNQWAGLFKQ